MTLTSRFGSELREYLYSVCRISLYFFYFSLLYNTVLVLPYIDMSPPWVYMSSQSWTPLPPPTPYHLSGLSPCTSTKHPISCIEHRLVIRFTYDIMHVSIPFSQIIPPSPSPTESKRLFYTSGSLLLSWFLLVLLPAQHFSWCTLHISSISRVTIYSLDITLFLFGTSLLFHVQF